MKRKPVVIEYTPKIGGTPVLPFVIDAYVSLRKDGNIEACDVPASGAEKAFYIRNKDRVVAVLSFFEEEEGKFLINMGFVAKAYRRRGYYGLLWKRLVQEARELEVASIVSLHKPSNNAILAFNEKVGRRIKYVCSEYIVPEADSNPGEQQG